MLEPKSGNRKGDVTTLEIRVLGPFEVLKDGRAITLPQGRLRAIVATLADAAGEVVSVDTLATAVWGARPPLDVRASLQTYIARLRQTLGRHVIVTAPRGYQLCVEPNQVDAWLFLRLLSDLPPAPEIVNTLDDALALWRGTPFTGVDSSWLAETRAPRLTECYLDAVATRADLKLAAGTSSDVVADLRTVTQQFPLHEPLWARLIAALQSTGQTAAAIACYEEVHERIAAELGVDPGTALQQARVSLSPSRIRLPHDTADFVGRADVLAALDGLLPQGADGSTAVVVLDGAPGVGKTTTAIHWAHSVAERFPDGQFFLDLHATGPGPELEPSTALELLLRELGAAPMNIPDDVDARSALLRSRLAERRVLLLLDNARGADQVRPLLPGSASMVVVTSRNQLRGLVARDGADRIALAEFSADESITYLTTASKLSRSRWNLRMLSDLADLCGRLPLALAVAAEQLEQRMGYGDRRLVSQLRAASRRIDVLSSTGDGGLDRGVRAVFRRSLDSLTPEQAKAFAVLGLHPGPDFSVDCAAAIVGSTAGEVLPVLDRLVEIHLLDQRQPRRYQLHDLLRLYAHELSGEDQPGRDAALDRLFAWYVHSAARARMVMGQCTPLGTVDELPATVVPREFGDVEDALDWFDVERTALLGAVEVATASGHDPAAWQLADQLSNYLAVRAAHDDLTRVQQIALESAQRRGNIAAQAVACNELGLAYSLADKHERARGYFRQAARLFSSLGDDIGHARALGRLGAALRWSGHLDRAIAVQQSAVEICDRAGDTDELVLALNELALSYLAVDDFDQAAVACRQALSAPETSNTPHLQPYVTDTLAQALTGLGEIDAALRCYRRAMVQAQAQRDKWCETAILNNLGRALRSAGRGEEARAHWEEALENIDTMDLVRSREVSREDLVTQIRSLGEPQAVST
ncbi:tetratricopeptide repeat protein [Kribbella pittospori]|uniref:Tetratricopeptide repeat protein n=1 Tax=Kribbella pittospori TaxID=722689 RepID=A0A4R0KY18_9ACTN|nr:BTAD domain-containing putative transcriptional regulator [Kribbella pittospori]TCC64226.1 tetratricopeptide repeat protein [Kribbella pittospori]